MLLALLLAAAPAAPPSLAFPGFNAVNLQPGEAVLYAEVLGQKLAALGFKVISGRDLAAALGLERQKELMGCGDSSCIAELAGALGADGLVVGDAGKLDDTYTLNVKVLSRDGKTLASHTATVPTAAAMPKALETAARAVAHQLAAELSRPDLDPQPLPVFTSTAISARRWSVVPIVLGGVTLLAGAVAQLIATMKLSALIDAGTLGEAGLYRDQGKAWETAGNALLAAGGTLAVAGILMFALGESAPPLTATVTPGGGSLGFAGVFP